MPSDVWLTKERDLILQPSNIRKWKKPVTYGVNAAVTGFS
jgi:hypothetical protein